MILRGLIGAAVLAALVLSRLWIAPRYLYYFDSVNFALALENFNPALHQPQPPGYPLFVALTRLLALFIPSPEHVFLLAGMLGAALAMLVIWRLGSMMFGASAGMLASLLLLFNPAFWMAGVTSQVRVFLAAGALMVMLAAWKAYEPASESRWFHAAYLALGVMSGFRPGLLIFLLPVLLWVGYRSRRTAREWLAAFALMAVVVAAWLSYTIQSAGGPGAYFDLIRSYVSQEFRGSSVLFGAPVRSAKRMALAAISWNGIGLLTWVWVLPWVWRRPRLQHRPLAIFLVLCFLPAFLFHAFVHVGDPDQTLVSIPVICLLGGGLLSRLPLARLRPAAALALLLNVGLFFHPLPGLARAASYQAVKAADISARSVYRAIRALQLQGPLCVVTWNSFITWRQLSYYFRDLPVIVLHQDPRSAVDPSSAWLLQANRVATPELAGSCLLLPPATRVAFLLPAGEQWRHLLASRSPVAQQGPLLVVNPQPGESIRFGQYSFRAAGH